MPLRPHLPQGWYLIYWRTISVDGHPVQGAFTYAVGPDPVRRRSSPSDTRADTTQMATNQQSHGRSEKGANQAFTTQRSAARPRKNRTMLCGIARNHLTSGSQGSGRCARRGAGCPAGVTGSRLRRGSGRQAAPRRAQRGAEACQLEVPVKPPAGVFLAKQDHQQRRSEQGAAGAGDDRVGRLRCAGDRGVAPGRGGDGCRARLRSG